jgi:hypothetical protein
MSKKIDFLGICVHENSEDATNLNVRCLCPSQYTGDHCTIERPCFDYCLNGASCKTSSENSREYECQCAHSFYGTQCQMNYACGLDCAYGKCVSSGDGKYVCKCPDGTGLKVDYSEHKR